MTDTILARHKRVENPHAGEAWCLQCDAQWPCPTISRLRRCDEYEAALRHISEMDHLIDIKEFANTVLKNG